MIHRRTLLTGLAMAPFAGLLAAESKPRLRIAQIGTSHAHASGKMDALRSLPDLYDVVGFAEPIAARQAAAQKAKSFAGLKYLTEAEILADPTIRVVVIETTLEDSAQAAMAALKAGKHIHLDKPGAEKHADFVALRRYAAEQGLTVQMGYMLRYNPAIQLLVRAVKEGWLGEVMEIDASMGKLLDEATRKRFAELPGGGMYELACHLVDTVVTLMGPPTSVQAFGNATRAPQDILVDNQLAVLSYPKATVTIRCNHADPFGGPHRALAVRGTRGAMEIRPLESGKGILRLDEPRDMAKVCRQVGDKMVMFAEPRFKKGETSFAVDVPKGRYDEEFRDLHRVVAGGQSFAWSADHDITVHATALRAAGLTP
ncbi:MAG: putative oxidoreductase YhhX [Verrucomicrobiota bacterium]|jgi:predicted dehydrogenase